MHRIKEPSTHAGIAAILAALAPALPQYAPILQGLIALFGGVAVVMRERGGA